MSTKLTLEYTPFSANQTLWFANAAAWNAYLSAMRVAEITSANLPSATTAEIGAVKQVALMNYSFVPLSATAYLTISTDQDGDGTPENYFIPNKDSFDALKTKVEALDLSFEQLITKIKAAGIMAS